MAKRCQVCDGPVKGDRCVLCGMLYRKDEELYHLNESRSTHYRHASEKARKIMRAQETALPDRNDGAIENEQAVQTLAEVFRQEAQKHKRDRLYADQKKRLAPKKVEKRKESGSASSSVGKKTFSADSANFKGKKERNGSLEQPSSYRTRKRRTGIILWGLFILLSVWKMDSCSSKDFHSAKNYIEFETEEAVQLLDGESEWYDDSEYKTLEEALSETEENSFLNSFYMYSEDAMKLMAESSNCTALYPNDYMSNWQGGYYMAVMKESSGILHISGEYGASSEYVSSESNYLVFELADGENVEFDNAGDEYAEVYIYSIDM